MKITFWGDSLTEGVPGVSFIPLLESKFPQCTIINYGVGGDSSVSLLERLHQIKQLEQVDLAFVWVGTNDVFHKASWTFPIIRFLKGQSHSKDAQEFQRSYRQILEIISMQATKVVALSPWLIGEDPQNRFNCELAELSGIAQDTSENFKIIEFLDVRQKAIEALDSKEISKYFATTLTRIMLDVFMLKEPAQVDQNAHERGLHFTLDGIHLNSAGAQLIADCCAPIIQRELQSGSL